MKKFETYCRNLLKKFIPYVANKINSIVSKHLWNSARHFYLHAYTEKSFRNLNKSSRNQNVFTIFRLIWIQTEVNLVPNQSKDGKYNLISVWFNKIWKTFLCVQVTVSSLLSSELSGRSAYPRYWCSYRYKNCSLFECVKTLSSSHNAIVGYL